MSKIFSSRFALPVIIFLLSFIIIKCKDNNHNTGNLSGTDASNNAPPILNHTIVKVYPHDTSSYTQGLTFYNNELYEGTGLAGRSKLMKVNLETGEIIKQIKLSDDFFGEGIAILRDTIYQLTWQQNVVFIYTLKDFKKVKEYHLDGEGWGITTDGQKLIVSNGSGDLYFYDPSTFRLLSKTSIMEGNSPTYNLNELEYFDGYVYANQYTYPYILKIDAEAGKVVAKYDISDMLKRVQTEKTDVDYLNGIAYNDSTKKIYVTGKLWPEMYEIVLGQ